METNLIQYKRILIAVDHTSCCKTALQHGYSLAVLHKASIALIHVNEPISPTTFTTDPVLGQQPVIIPENMVYEEEEINRNLLEEYTKELKGVSEIFTFIRTGQPREEILNVAEEWKADLIVVGNHKKTGLDHLLSGSVSQRIARKSSCPVLIIPKC